MSDSVPLRRWLPLSDAVTQVSERLGLPTENARRSLFNALKDEITRARGQFWDGSNDRVYLKEINLDIFLNNKIDWDKDEIVLDDPIRDYGRYWEVLNVEVYGETLDEWLEAHRSGEPADSRYKGTDVVEEEVDVTRPASARRRKGGPRPGPYLLKLQRFLKFLLDNKGPDYFSHGISAIEHDVRKRFARDDPNNRLRLPKRTGLQEQIKRWMRDNNLLD